MDILVTAATENEWRPLQRLLSVHIENTFNHINIHWHTCGVGIMLSTLSLYQQITTTKPNLVLLVGIAGSYVPDLELGKVVVVKEEYLGDIGVEEGGKFNDIFDMGFVEKDVFPFTGKALRNPWVDQYNLLELPVATGITINEITTKAVRIRQLKEQFGAEVESMEGAALHYAGLQAATPFIQLRAVSNFVGERDKSKWKLLPALEQLANTAAKWLIMLDRQSMSFK